MNIEFHHICIETDDYKESLAFYTKAMGLQILEEKRDFHGRDYNTWMKNGSVIIELQTPKIADKDLPSLGNRGIRHVCFKVKDLDEAINRLETLGFKDFLDGKKKYQVFDSFLCKLKAPEGTVIELRE